MIHTLARVCKLAIVVLLGAMTLLTASQVLLRYAFSSPWSWAEEAVRYMFVYLIFIGAALGVYERAHFNIPVLVDRLPRSAQRILKLSSTIILVAFLGFLVVFGAALALNAATQSSPALGLPMLVPYAAIPLGGALSLIFLLRPGPEPEEVLAT